MKRIILALAILLAGSVGAFAQPQRILTGCPSTGCQQNGAIVLFAGTLALGNGNTFVQAEGPISIFTGTESTFVGDRAGGAVGSGSFNWIAGHDAFGIGGGCTAIYAGAVTVTGTDNLRNTCGAGGAAGLDSYGVGVLKTYNQAGTSSNNYLTGTAAFGSGSLYYWNAPVSNPYNTAFGNSACQGSSTGTVSFVGVLCIGPRSGIKLTSASNSILINGGGSGGCIVGCTNYASGSGVILVSSGKAAVDTPAAGTTNFINLENTYIASTAVPAFVSGFGSNAGWHGVASGGTSETFGWSLGTGGTASTGVFAFPTAAPNGWFCIGRDVTNPSSIVLDFAATSPTQVTLTSYSRTTGSVTAWPSGDWASISCQGF